MATVFDLNVLLPGFDYSKLKVNNFLIEGSERITGATSRTSAYADRGGSYDCSIVKNWDPSTGILLCYVNVYSVYRDSNGTWGQGSIERDLKTKVMILPGEIKVEGE